jgi:pimeloyl-ACP methyl ester carboxylesterase
MSATIKINQFAQIRNKVKLHYASAGEKGKPLILFLHGFPEFWFQWEAQLKELGKDYFVVAPDMRGVNLSDMPADVSAYKAKYIIEDVRFLATHLGYEKFVLVAHDWGGAVAWSFAIAWPQRLNKLIIINAPHPYLFMRALIVDAEQQKASEYINWLRGSGSEAILTINSFALLEQMLNKMGPWSSSWFSEEVRQKYHECWLRGLGGGVKFYRSSPLHPPTPGDPGPRKMRVDPNDFRIKVPTRVIWGEQDKALLPNQLDGLEKFIEDLRIERVPDGSHWLLHEHPERINQLLRGFLAE